MRYLLGTVFWDHWYDYGSELTGVPVDRWGSLIPGTFLHSLQGYTLALGFYILYKRHSLLNALCYVWLLLSTVYTWTFPTYVLVDFRPPAQWFFVVWWAHFWMALAAWYLPKSLYSPRLWERLRSLGARAVVVAVLLPFYFLPVSFVFWRAHTWQFPTQRAIDTATFEGVQLVVWSQPAAVTGGGGAAGGGAAGSAIDEAAYEFTLRFGPRPYKDYIKATKALDAGPVAVTGRLVRDGHTVAWCAAYVTVIETPNNITDPQQYFPALKRMEYTDIPVRCYGPKEAAAATGGPLGVQWVANVTLVGDREQESREFRGRSGAA
jgi:hypothetical protein